MALQIDPRGLYRIGSNDPEHRTEYDAKVTYVLGYIRTSTLYYLGYEHSS
jgi:hypothetical protein